MESTRIDFTELDNRSTSQIHKLVGSPIQQQQPKPGTSKSMVDDQPVEIVIDSDDDRIEQNEISHLEIQELEFINSIFDKETIEELEENMMMDNDAGDDKDDEQKSNDETRTPGLQEINETLLSTMSTQPDNESPELSSISPEIMDELLKVSSSNNE
ncbi:hypothetical protein BLA29_012362 [Euroglyphus maynei]|uniref:Uncharacterized protein n=1 Tax=Euroglyphus maynei TaxID=6958 RepID=A0A1Y3B1E8_EURMA|nr:hypothetical protein BLA29_012362 [Euroglyphus maynei]